MRLKGKVTIDGVFHEFEGTTGEYEKLPAVADKIKECFDALLK